ncbi:hypothetical protein IW262DRAFT_1357558 [Armillaria fumosa]|nr:hypothetical protein IW262DRAFT_1357558 [Armillaria fumosa]
MPPQRRFRCAYSSYPSFSSPVKKSPKKRRSEMTEEEKREADLQTTLRKAKSTAKKEWESSLPEPWKGPHNFKWPTGTLGMYKSDAKRSYGLTEREILTLPFESIEMSSKTFFSHADVKELSFDKYSVFDILMPDRMTTAGKPIGMEIRLFRKIDHDPNRRFRTNWFDLDGLPVLILPQYEAKDTRNQVVSGN